MSQAEALMQSIQELPDGTDEIVQADLA